jgi:hypothetical protein
MWTRSIIRFKLSLDSIGKYVQFLKEKKRKARLTLYKK